MKLYRYFSAWIIALGFALCISTLSFGQVGAMAIFDQWLDKHEDVRNDLTKNPNLIDDPAYLQKRPHLRAFLEDHPNTRRELKDNPKLFMSRESAYDKAQDKKDNDKDKK